MVLLDAFLEGDVYIDFPYEDAKFRFEKASGKYYRRFYDQAEDEIAPDSALLHEAISAGRLITREEYLADPEGPSGAPAESTAAALSGGAEELLGKPASDLEAREEYLADPEGPSGAPAGSTAAGLPSGAEELLGKPASDLEAEFRRLASSCRLPPSAVRQLFESYALQSRLAEDAQRESQQRTFLINAIVVYRRPELRLRPGEDWPAAELMKIALTMPMRDDPTARHRRDILGNLLEVYDQETFAPEDRDFYRCLALADFIKNNAADPGILDRPR
jgi:hypothetical protein